MGDWPSILSVLSTRSTKWKQAFELPMDCHSPSELQSSAHIATFLFKLIPENSWLVVYVSTTCFQELGPFLQTLLRLNHKNKNSSHKLRKSWIACSHGNQWPPEPVLNLFSYDNPPQLTALVRKPASPWWPLASESQLVRDRLSPDLSGVNSHSPSDCPAEGISPRMSVKFTSPWPWDVPKTLYQCATVCSARRDCAGPAVTYFRHWVVVSSSFEGWSVKLTSTTWSWWYSTVYDLQKRPFHTAKPYKFEHNEGPIFTMSGPWLCHPSALCFLCSSHPGFLFPHLQHALTSFSLPPSPASFTPVMSSVWRTSFPAPPTFPCWLL